MRRKCDHIYNATSYKGILQHQWRIHLADAAAQSPIRTFGRSPLAIGLGLVLALADDDVRWLLGLVREVVLQDGLDASRIPRLCVEGCARVVRYHAVATAERVLHRPPRVVLWRGLHVPDVTGVAVDLPGLERRGDRVLVTDRTTRGVDEPRTLQAI